MKVACSAAEREIVRTGNLVGQAFVSLGAHEDSPQNEPYRNQSNTCQEEPTGLFQGHEQTEEVSHVSSIGNLGAIPPGDKMLILKQLNVNGG